MVRFAHGLFRRNLMPENLMLSRAAAGVDIDELPEGEVHPGFRPMTSSAPTSRSRIPELRDRVQAGCCLHSSG